MSSTREPAYGHNKQQIADEFEEAYEHPPPQVLHSKRQTGFFNCDGSSGGRCAAFSIQNHAPHSGVLAGSFKTVRRYDPYMNFCS